MNIPFKSSSTSFIFLDEKDGIAAMKGHSLFCNIHGVSKAEQKRGHFLIKHVAAWNLMTYQH